MTAKKLTKEGRELIKQEMEKTFEDFIKEVLPLLLRRLVTKIENEVVEGDVSAYWAGTVLRIDIKPKQ